MTTSNAVAQKSGDDIAHGFPSACRHDTEAVLPCEAQVQAGKPGPKNFLSPFKISILTVPRG